MTIPASMKTAAKRPIGTGLNGYSPTIAVGKGMNDRQRRRPMFHQISPSSTIRRRAKKRWWFSQKTAMKKKLKR